MRVSFVRISALVGGVVLVLSCDGGPVGTKFGNGIAGGTTGTSPITPPAAGSVDTSKPFVRIDSPVTAPVQLINAGDSILVVTRIIDDRKVGTLLIRGLQYTGSASLGTLTQVERYPAITAPVAGTQFRPGLQDTVIRRYLKPAAPVDTSADSLVIQAIHTDSAGNVDTTRRVIRLVNGPKVTITAPVANDSVPRGISFTVSVTADHPAGVDSIEIHVFGDATFPAVPPYDTIVKAAYPSGTTSATLTASIPVPVTAPARGKITINARARDGNRNQGNAPPIVIFARAVSNVNPRVYQTVPAKMEYKGDSITVTANADGVKTIGRIMLDSALRVIDSAVVNFTTPLNGNRTARLPLRDTLSDQGRRISIITFAIDSANNVGWSLPAGAGTPVTARANASRDTVLISYGRTFKLPRAGIAGDLAVDEPRGNVYVSNTSYNLLEIWNNASKTFGASGVQVGSQPWGLFVAKKGANSDTLLVANSGSTTISKVNMAAATPVEVLSKRIHTRNTVAYEVSFSVSTAGVISIGLTSKVWSFSDRPQYLAQSGGGRIYYSTRPTDAARPGTLRWLDPALSAPEDRQIWSYGTILGTTLFTYKILNLDSLSILKGATGTVTPDSIRLYDHPYGTSGPDFMVSDVRLDTAIAKAIRAGSDVEAVLGLDMESLSLTDTNFVAASTDRRWIAFGEGNAAKIIGSLFDQGVPTARIMMVRDPGGQPTFFSKDIQVRDLQENASEKVFGLALDSLGLQLLAHGDKSFVATVDLPFHLRLDGIYDSFDNGAGVAFHPGAQGTNTAAVTDRVAFTATKSGVIEVFDVAHYNNRGRMVTKGNLYGPLRVTRPLAGDPASVILKLYGLTDAGLIVIDLQAKDILP